MVVHRRFPAGRVVNAERALLACGFLAPAVYVAMNVFVPMAYPGYDAMSQTVSELSAIDAPTRPLWCSLGIIYTLSSIAFAIGVLRASGTNRSLGVAGLLLLIQGVSGPMWPPMHSRVALAAGAGSLTDTLHIAFAMVWSLLAMLTVVIASRALGRSMRLASWITLAIMLAFGFLTSLQAPSVDKNLRTPLMGLWERIDIAAYLIWTALLAWLLLKRGASKLR